MTYYFHLRNGNVFTRDHEGRVLSDMAEVHRSALLEARSLMGRDIMTCGILNLNQRIEVEDEHGNCVYTLYFADAVVVGDVSRASG